MASFKSAESIESISVRVEGVGVGVGRAGGGEEGDGEALGLAGDCAAKFVTALQAQKAKINRRTRRDIRATILSRNRAQSNITAVMAPLEMDLRDGLIGSISGGGHGIA